MEKVFQQLHRWLNKRVESEIHPETTLLGNIIDSATFVELVATIEMLSGVSIDFTPANFDRMRNLSSIKRHFFHG